jgi:hypothetical protein
LIEEKVLVSEEKRYSFNFKKNNSAVKSYESRLGESETFIATQIGIYLSRVEKAKEGAHPLLTFPAPNAFPEAEHLEAVFRGFLDVTIDQRIVVSDFSLQRFRHVPTTQPTGGYPAAAGNPALGYDYGAGLHILSPFLVLFGNADSEFTIKIPSYSGQVLTAAATTHENRLVVCLEGFIATGVQRKVEQKG